MKQFLLTLLLVANVSLFAQHKTENLSMGPSYINDVYYSLDSGEVASVDRSGWHVAFSTQGFDVSTRINAASGHNAYVASSNMADWSTIDTAGNAWDKLYDSELTWEEGAFVTMATGHPDYGWGTYNSTTHNVTASKIFFVQIADTIYKKFVIDSMNVNGDFKFYHANIDGSDSVYNSFNKNMYSDVNFMYYDMLNDSIFSLEPKNDSWDFMFTKYYSLRPQGSMYNVTGALLNAGSRASKATDMDTNMVDHNNYPLTDTAINIIGGDWKHYDFGSQAFILDDSTSFFVEAQSGNLFKVVFKDWSGMSSGDLVFTTALVSAISIDELETMELVMYPNPARDYIQIEGEENLDVQIVNFNGSVVKQSNIEGNGRIDLSNLASGTYIIRATSNKGIYQSKLIVL